MSEHKPIDEMNEDELAAFVATLPEEVQQEIQHRYWLETMEKSIAAGNKA